MHLPRLMDADSLRCVPPTPSFWDDDCKSSSEDDGDDWIELSQDSTIFSPAKHGSSSSITIVLIIPRLDFSTSVGSFG